MINKIAYTHGRFQPFHNGHFKLMLNILNKYSTLWIGIANPVRSWSTKMDSLAGAIRKSVDRARSPENNPFSFIQRYEMIEKSLQAAGIEKSRFRILPHFGFYDCDRWEDFFPPKKETVICLSPKDPHHFEKIEVYKEKGYALDLMNVQAGSSGEEFRRAYPKGNWQILVPIGTKQVLENLLSL